MRIADGGREKTFKDGSVGYVHRLGSGTIAVAPVNGTQRRTEPKPTINASKLMAGFDPRWGIPQLAKDLGVSEDSLHDIGCRWTSEYRAFAFPMVNGYGEAVGIRLRATDGRKWAVTGSRQGIFLSSREAPKRAYVTEGPTDLAAALTMGLWAVGRPHCAGGIEDIKLTFKRHSVMEAVILSDNDAPGRLGATMLRNHLKIPTALLVLPCKDIREMLCRGGTAEDVENLVSNLTWSNPTDHPTSL
jgi:hypothetical protein